MTDTPAGGARPAVAAVGLPSGAETGTGSGADADLGSLPEQVRSLYAFLPSARVGFIAGVVVVAATFWNHAPASLMVPWLAAFLVMGVARLVLERRYHRAEPRTRQDWLRWRLGFNIGTLVAAVLLGLTGWLFQPLGGLGPQTVLIVVIFSFAVAGVAVLATQPRIYAAFVLLALLPLMGRVAASGTLANLQLAATLLFIVLLTAMLARTYRQSVQHVIELKAHAEQLLAQLTIEKQSADAARKEAEAANRAKTQFFTAASHDLRQPLHAMGLFAEALRQRVHEPEVAQLVHSINESVDALEGLFSELLDITRIDSGGVEVQPRSFALEDIFRRLKLHFEPIAFDKGLALTLRGGQRVAHADPLLVERILRNLVSNAIRYTDDGGVLVACRLRGGRLLLQVWDTGRGIPADQQALVFDEFYRVPGSDRVAPGERKGLGLGLSIVKRLSMMMEAPLTLASQPGRGTVFSLTLPVGRAVSRAPAAAQGKAPTELTLQGRHLVIVEDEDAVRQGLQVLLAGWGAIVSAFDSVTACREWAQGEASAQVRRPDLLLVDYRLENGHTGIDALRVLRQRFGAEVPAVVVTGSTMSGHEQEAQEHDFHVLTKPVLPGKLRAMIAFKLGAGRGHAARGE